MSPEGKTGTAEDLSSIIIRADERRVARDGLPVQVKSAFQRVLLEALLNLVGRGLSFAARAIPASWMFQAHDAGLRGLVGSSQHPFDRSGRLERAADLLRQAEAETGMRAAILAIISHGPVHGRFAYMNLELVRHAGWVLRQMRGACRPRLVIAVDPFALDTVSVAEEALYAGFMGHYHLGIDRAAFSRGALSSLALRCTAWHRMPFRLLKGLSAGGEFAMALAGGVPATTRGRYVVREWLCRMRKERPSASEPSDVLARLRRIPAFHGFEEAHPEWIHPRSVWRRMEAWLMASLEEPCLSDRGPSSAETGILDGPAKAAARGCLEAFGSAEEPRARGLAALEEELSRETPYRERFFRLVASRVLGRGRPVVFVPVIHHTDGEGGVALGDPWAWLSLGRGTISARDGTGREWQGSAAGFGTLFGRENFSANAGRPR
ncbi:MAG: hypothetical protein HZB91_13890 [Elusimicrobia bacterium]|nr:hypothetical protein [Elusimicrobiota bacterium]